MILNYLLLALPFVALFFYLKWVHYGASGKELAKIIKKEAEEAERKRIKAEKAQKLKSALNGEGWSDKLPEGVDFLGFYNYINSNVMEMTKEGLLKAGIMKLLADGELMLGEEMQPDALKASDLPSYTFAVKGSMNDDKVAKGKTAAAFCDNLHQMLLRLSFPKYSIKEFTKSDSENLKKEELKALYARPFARNIKGVMKESGWDWDDKWDERYSTVQFRNYLQGLPDHDEWPIDEQAPWDEYLLMATTFGGERRLLQTLARRCPKLAESKIAQFLSGGSLTDKNKKAFMDTVAKVASGAALAIAVLKTFQTMAEILEAKRAAERSARESSYSHSSSSSSWSSGGSRGGSYGGGSSGGGGAGGSW